MAWRLPHCPRLTLLLALGCLAFPARTLAVSPPQSPRDLWKDCIYNEEVIRCQDIQTANHIRIVWYDGIRTRLDKQQPSHPDMPSYWKDRYGGLWRRELLIQGNTQLTNLRTGNRIVIPLRLTCKPPLKGEVGYCREDSSSPHTSP